MEPVYVDTNVIVRFVTGEPQDQAAIVADFLQQSDNGEILVHLNPMIIAEVVFVLTGKVYAYPKESVSKALRNFINNPAFIVDDLENLLTALDWFAKYAVDFADAYLAACASQNGATVVSFDSDFKKLKFVKSRNLKPKSR